MKALIISILLVGGTFARSQSVHGFLFGDTNNTLSSYRDITNMQEFASYLAKNLEYSYVDHHLAGNDLSAKSISNLLNSSLPYIDTEDVVILYFSGHGIKDIGDPEPFPRVVIGDKLYNSYDWYKRIEQRHPRFFLTVMQSCSEYASKFQRDSINLQNSLVTNNRLIRELLVSDQANILAYKLFENDVNVIISAASPGELTYSGTEGSVLTTNLIKFISRSLEQDKNSSNLSWTPILDSICVSTTREFQKIGVKVNPMIKLEMSSDSNAIKNRMLSGSNPQVQISTIDEKSINSKSLYKVKMDFLTLLDADSIVITFSDPMNGKKIVFKKDKILISPISIRSTTENGVSIKETTYMVSATVWSYGDFIIRSRFFHHNGAFVEFISSFTSPIEQVKAEKKDNGNIYFFCAIGGLLAATVFLILSKKIFRSRIQ